MIFFNLDYLKNINRSVSFTPTATFVDLKFVVFKKIGNISDKVSRLKLILVLNSYMKN